MGPGVVDHLPQQLRVLQHGAGEQVVAVEGLSVMVGHEDRGAQAVQQGRLPDVAVGVMDEHAGVHVAVGVDVEIPPPAGDAAAYVLAVVLEVHGEDGLGGADLPDAAVHGRPLPGAGQEGGDRVVAHGHVVEVPDELGAPLHQLVHKLVRADGIQILTGVAGGDAEGQLFLPEDGHGPQYLLIDALPAAAVGGLLEALQTDGGDKVLYTKHIVRKGLVNKGGVGKGEELAVRMLLAQGDQVLFADQWLAAGVDVHVDPKGLALLDDGVDLVKGQVQLVAVLSRPAAGAVEIAGAGGVQKDGPGDVAVVLRPELLLDGPADDVGIEEKVLEGGFQHVVVHVPEDVHDEPVHVVGGVIDDRAEGVPLGLEAVRPGARQLVHPLHQLGQILLGVLLDVVEGCLQPEGGEGFGNHGASPFSICISLSGRFCRKGPASPKGPGCVSKKMLCIFFEKGFASLRAKSTNLEKEPCNCLLFPVE